MNRPEEAVHRTCVEYLALCVPRPPEGPLWFHVPNQKGTRSIQEMQRLKGMGVVPGIPDLVLIWAGRAYGVEVKASGGCLSRSQKECASAWCAAGASHAVVRSLDQFCRVLTAWGIPTREVAA